MLHEKVSTMLNQQINKEMYSAYLYLHIANYYTNLGLAGFANWFRIQAQEEMDHAMIFMTYLQNNNFEVELEAIAKPEADFKDSKEPLVAALDHEYYITDSIHKIYEVSVQGKDFRTQEFLHWFIKEQGEEEKNATELVQKYDFAKHNIYQLDRELSARTYSPADYDFD